MNMFYNTSCQQNKGGQKCKMWVFRVDKMSPVAYPSVSKAKDITPTFLSMSKRESCNARVSTLRSLCIRYWNLLGQINNTSVYGLLIRNRLINWCKQTLLDRIHIRPFLWAQYPWHLRCHRRLLILHTYQEQGATRPSGTETDILFTQWSNMLILQKQMG